MTDIKIAVKGNHAALLRPANLVAGTVGQKCKFYFDDQWRAYTDKYVTYKVGSTLLGSYKIEDSEVKIPKNVLIMAELPLEIGVTGTTSDGAVVPTPWCRIGTIKKGASINKAESSDDEIIYDGGGVDSSDEIIYEGGTVNG